MAALASILDELIDTRVVDAGDLAQITGAISRPMSRRTTTKAMPRREAEDRFVELKAVVGQLRSVLRDEPARLWLHSPNPDLDLDWRRPLQPPEPPLRRRRAEKVRRTPGDRGGEGTPGGPLPLRDGAPSLVPTAPGDSVKTDKRDARLRCSVLGSSPQCECRAWPKRACTTCAGRGEMVIVGAAGGSCQWDDPDSSDEWGSSYRLLLIRVG